LTAEPDETFRPASGVMPVDGPSPAFDAALDGEETVDWEALAEMIEDFLVHGIAGPLGNGDCEVSRSEISHGTKHFA
jgi:hypothetical protein